MELRCAQNVASMEKTREYVLVSKPEEKWPLGGPYHRWKYDINVDLKERGWGYGISSYGLGLGPTVGACEYGNEFSGSIKRKEFLGYLSIF
jgi:hypothetical protein